MAAEEQSSPRILNKLAGMGAIAYHEHFLRLRRRLSVLYNTERFAAIRRREGTPVNGATERAPSLRKALAYVAEEWTP